MTTTHRAKALATLATAALLLGGCATVPPPAAVPTPVPTPTYETPEPALSVWTDRANATYRVGEPIKLYLRPVRDIQVVLVNIDAHGNTAVVYPNQFEPHNRLRAGQVVEVPGTGAYSLAAARPLGNGLIRVIASTQMDTPLTAPGGQPPAPPPNADWTIIDLPITVVDAHAPVLAAPVAPPAVVTAPPQPAPEPATPQATHSGDFGLTVQLSQPAYRVGDELRFTVRSDRECLLTVTNTDERGQTAVLYPNARQGKVRLADREAVTLPRVDLTGGVRFPVGGPPGAQNLTAACTASETYTAGSQRSAIAAEDVPSPVTTTIAEVLTAPVPSARVDIRYEVLP